MNRLKRFLTDTADALLRVALRYPVETALCIYVCIVGAIQIEWNFDYRTLLAADDAAACEMRQLPDGVFTMLPLTMLATLIVHTLVRRAARAWRVLYLLVPILLTAASWLLGEEWFGTSRFFITSAILAPLGLLMARRAVANGPFVRQTLGYVRAAVVGWVFALTAMLAAMAIYHSVAYIFGIWTAWEVQQRVDAYILLLSWGFWPLTALARLDGYLSDEPQGTKTTDALLNWILAPALLVYAAILYLYCLQILFAWTLPKGGVAYLVFGFTIALFVVKALQELVVQRRYDWFFDRISLFALPPLVLFWAGVAQRVADYGLTDWRVYLLVCGAIMTVAVGLFAARRTGRYYYIAATAFALFFLTAYIPRFSATALSLRSQTARAERLARETNLLDEAGRLDLARIDEHDTAQLKRYHELYASLDYLDDRDTLLLADRFGIARSREFLANFRNDRISSYIRWGGSEGDSVVEVVTNSYSESERCRPICIEGYRYCYDPVSYNDGRARFSTDNDTLRLYLPGTREVLCRSFEELLHDRAEQLRLPLDDEALYTADNLLVYRTDSLLISFSQAEVSREKSCYTYLNIDKAYTK